MTYRYKVGDCVELAEWFLYDKGDGLRQTSVLRHVPKGTQATVVRRRLGYVLRTLGASPVTLYGVAEADVKGVTAEVGR